jgi:predicted RNA-binding protein (virulence factor B family)
MIDVGTFHTLPIANLTPIGVYLDAGTGHTETNILLPKKEVSPDARKGDELKVFIYRDSEDRLIATCRTPLAQVGDVTLLRVVQNTDVGAFLDWGLEKDLFLPFNEQKYRVEEGKRYLVAVYLDKRDRICATTNVSKYLRTDSPYQKNDLVSGTVYLVKPEFGAFVAVENRYAGMIPNQELFSPVKRGMYLEDLRVTRVREDGQLDLSLRKMAYQQMQDDAAWLLEVLRANQGMLPLHDKSHPGAIKHHLHLSKSAFKRAVGQLLKAGKIELIEGGIRLKH